MPCTYCEHDRKLNHEGVCQSCQHSLDQLHANKEATEQFYQDRMAYYADSFKKSIAKNKVEYENSIVDDTGYVKEVFYIVTKALIDGLVKYLLDQRADSPDFTMTAFQQEIDKLELKEGDKFIFSATSVNSDNTVNALFLFKRVRMRLGMGMSSITYIPSGLVKLFDTEPQRKSAK